LKPTRFIADQEEMMIMTKDEWFLLPLARID